MTNRLDSPRWLKATIGGEHSALLLNLDHVAQITDLGDKGCSVCWRNDTNEVRSVTAVSDRYEDLIERIFHS